MTRAGRPIAVTLAAAFLGGCGGGAHHTAPPAPKLPSALAEQLATQSDAVAGRLDAGDDCGAFAAAQQLQRQTIAAINAHRVPAAFQEPLSAAANDLNVRIRCTPKDDHRGKGKHKGDGKHGGEGD